MSDRGGVSIRFCWIFFIFLKWISLGFINLDNTSLMPGLHSRWEFSSRLTRNSEWDEVCTNVDIHILVWELWDRYKIRKSRNSRELATFYSFTFFTQLQTTICIEELNENVIRVSLITKRNISFPLTWDWFTNKCLRATSTMEFTDC